MTAKARAMNVVPKTALAGRLATKARADNKFSRKRSRRLGGSPAVFVRTAHAELRQLSQKQLLYPLPAGARGKYGGRRINERTPQHSYAVGPFMEVFA